MSLVREFHEAAGQAAPKHPPLHPDVDLIRQRLRLIDEEHKEVRNDLIALTKATDPDKIVRLLRALLKELADLRYVVEGTAVSLGLPFEEAYAEVHRSNMSKFGEDGRPILNTHGKVLKGPNYSEADLTALVPDIIPNEEAS